METKQERNLESKKCFELVNNFIKILFEEKSPEEIQARNEKKIEFEVVDNKIKIIPTPTGKGFYSLIKEKNIESKKCSDEDFDILKQEAKLDKDKAINLYRRYVGSSETIEERIRRINKFRCG